MYSRGDERSKMPKWAIFPFEREAMKRRDRSFDHFVLFADWKNMMRFVLASPKKEATRLSQHEIFKRPRQIRSRHNLRRNALSL